MLKSLKPLVLLGSSDSALGCGDRTCYFWIPVVPTLPAFHIPFVPTFFSTSLILCSVSSFRLIKVVSFTLRWRILVLCFCYPRCRFKYPLFLMTTQKLTDRTTHPAVMIPRPCTLECHPMVAIAVPNAPTTFTTNCISALAEPAT